MGTFCAMLGLIAANATRRIRRAEARISTFHLIVKVPASIDHLTDLSDEA
jgi:hypothetical protein